MILDDAELTEYLKSVKISKGRDQVAEIATPEPMVVDTATAESVVTHLPECITTVDSNVEDMDEDAGNVWKFGIYLWK